MESALQAAAASNTATQPVLHLLQAAGCPPLPDVASWQAAPQPPPSPIGSPPHPTCDAAPVTPGFDSTFILSLADMESMLAGGGAPASAAAPPADGAPPPKRQAGFLGVGLDDTVGTVPALPPAKGAWPPRWAPVSLPAWGVIVQ